MAITKVTNSVVGSGSATDGYVLTADGSGNSAWEAAAGGGVDGIVSSADATAMTINSSEQIGIGHAAPVHKLHVFDSTTAASDTHPELAVGIQTTGIKTNSIIQLWSSAAGTIHFGDAASPWDGYISYGHSDQSLNFGANGATKMSLVHTTQSNGVLRIGTSSVLASSVEKVGITGGGGVTIKTTSYAYWSPLILWNNSSTANNSTTLDYIQFSSLSNGTVGSITSVGTTTSYNTSSDYRLKENVDYTWDATTRLKQLKPARFNWISDETNTLVDGFLAHEVSSIVPEAITGEKDATETNENCVLNALGNCEVKGVTEAEWIAGKLPTLWTEDDELPEGVSVGDIREEAAYTSDTTWVASHTQDVNQSIDQSKLVPLLTKALQEQQTIIEDLQARIETLENA